MTSVFVQKPFFHGEGEPDEIFILIPFILSVFLFEAAKLLNYFIAPKQNHHSRQRCLDCKRISRYKNTLRKHFAFSLLVSPSFDDSVRVSKGYSFSIRALFCGINYMKIFFQGLQCTNLLTLIFFCPKRVGKRLSPCIFLRKCITKAVVWFCCCFKRRGEE